MVKLGVFKAKNEIKRNLSVKIKVFIANAMTRNKLAL